MPTRAIVVDVSFKLDQTSRAAERVEKMPRRDMPRADFAVSRTATEHLIFSVESSERQADFVISPFGLSPELSLPISLDYGGRMDGSSTAVSVSTKGSVRHVCTALHLTDDPLRIAALTTSLSASRIRPRIATGRGVVTQLAPLCEAQGAASWQTAWGQVPRWREVLLSAQKEASCEVVHAHTFTAGMAAVRNFHCVVYELEDFIEKLLATESKKTARGSGGRFKWRSNLC